MNEETINYVPEEPKRHNKKRLLILLLLLLLTGIMLTTSTYAWFTANQTVSVSNIRVNVAAQNGIQISANGTTWKSILQTTDITGAHANQYTTSVNQIPDVLEPVSTVQTVTAGKMEMWYGEVKTNAGGDYILTDTASVETESNGPTSTGKFIAFDIFLKVTQQTQVYLSSASGITTDDVTDTGIKNAARIEFITLGNVANGTALATIQALDGTAEGYPTKLMWEPNWDAHTAAGQTNANDVYGITTNVSPTAASNTASVPYDGVKAAVAEADNIKLNEATAALHATQFASVTPDIKTRAAWTGTTTPTYENLFILKAGITKVRIYVWVEGQDVDCENTASGGNIIFNLQITTVNT